MTAIANRFATTTLNLPASQTPASRAAAKSAAAPTKPADVVELAKARAATNDPMVDLNAAPILPSSGNATLPRDFGDQLGVYSAEMDGGAGALAWESLMEMARSASIDIRTAADLRAAMHQGATDAKAAAIVKTERQQGHERAASLQSLGVNIAVQLVAVTVVGGQLGIGLSNTAGAISNAWTQNIGPGRKAQQEKLEQMHQELQGSIFEGNIDSAKANYDDAKEQFKLALRILSEHAERQTQITNTITRV